MHYYGDSVLSEYRDPLFWPVKCCSTVLHSAACGSLRVSCCQHISDGRGELYYCFCSPWGLCLSNGQLLHILPRCYNDHTLSGRVHMFHLFQATGLKWILEWLLFFTLNKRRVCQDFLFLGVLSVTGRITISRECSWYTRRTSRMSKLCLTFKRVGIKLANQLVSVHNSCPSWTIRVWEGNVGSGVKCVWKYFMIQHGWKHTE